MHAQRPPPGHPHPSTTPDASASVRASAPNGLTAYFRSEESTQARCRSRAVSQTVLFGQVDVPMPPPAIIADWRRETLQHLALAPGDVEVMPIGRTRGKWSGYSACVQAMIQWTRTQGFGSLLADRDVALMACRGAHYHHDAAQYGGAAFCNLFLSEDKGLDVHFPHSGQSGQRVALTRGTAMIFDTGQPHGVIHRRSPGFRTEDFDDAHDQTQLFLSWELAIDDPQVAQALGVQFDVMPDDALPTEEHVALNGERVHVCPATGRWL